MFWKLAAIAFLLWYWSKLWKIRRIIAAARQIDSFVSFPLIGHGHMFYGTNSDLMSAMKKFSEKAIKSNVTGLWLGFDFYAFSVSAEDIHYVNRKCLDKANIVKFAQSLIGDGSLFAKEHIWRPRRKMMCGLFAPRHFDSFVSVFCKQSAVLMQTLLPLAGGQVFSIWPFLTRYTLDSICENGLGVEVQSQTSGEQPFLAALSEYMRLVSRRALRPWLHPRALYRRHPDAARQRRHEAAITAFVNDVIEQKCSELRGELSSDNKKNYEYKDVNASMLETLLRARAAPAATLREEMLVLVLAGTDTSAVGAAFAALLLSRHPRVQSVARQEIVDVMGNNLSININSLSKLKYLEAVIKETLRLYPPVPFAVRYIDTDITLPSGINLPSGCNFMASHWGVHRNPKYWGADAEEFHPDRFMRDDVNSAAFLAFSCGPKVCLGYKYAMISLKTMLATLLWYYQVLPAHDTHTPLKLEFNIMLKDVDEFKVKLIKR